MELRVRSLARVAAVGGLVAMVGFSSCGRGRNAPSDGFVSVLGGALIRTTECGGEFCEPNYIYTADFGRGRSNPAPAPQPALPAEKLDYSRGILNVADAWKVTEGSREVVVAVVDSGVDYNHPDLRNNIWVNEAEKTGRTGVDDDGNGFVDDIYGWDFANNRPNAMDDNSHGTHCSGIIGAERNGVGIVGISPKVRIMPVKFLNAQGQGDLYAAVGAIRYATRMGARVISNSWGGGGYSALLDQAIQEAVNRGVIITAAAGNSAADNDSSPNYPSGYSNVIAVASTDANDDLSSFSNFGANSVFIAAPGSGILSSVPGSRWASYSGTSMATPQVSGAIALALSIRPNLTAGDLKTALCASAKSILLGKVVCGRMDIGALIAAI